MSINKWIGKTALGLLILLIFMALALIWWGNHPREAMPEGLQHVESDQNILVRSGDWIAFRPHLDSSLTGIIFYPGGHVDPRACAPMAKQLASAGNLVIIPRMPLNLAVEYISGNPSFVDGLFLWASYFAKNTDLSGFANLKVLTIYGTEDSDIEKISASRKRLPRNTVWHSKHFPGNPTGVDNCPHPDVFKRS